MTRAGLGALLLMMLALAGCGWISPVRESILAVSRFAGSCDVRASDVVVAGNYAYVNAGPVKIVDVTDKSAPRVVGEVPGTYAATGMAVGGTHLYLGDADGFHVYDISTPASPTLSGEYACECGSLCVEGSYAYAITSDGLRIIDVSNPSLPSAVGVESSLDSINSRLAVNANHVYVTTDVPSFSIRTVDVSDKSDPVIVDTYAVSGSPEDILVTPDGHLCIACLDSLLVFSLADPASPGFLGKSTELAGGRRLARAGTGGLYSAFFGGICEVSLVDASAPTVGQGYRSPLTPSVTVSGLACDNSGYAYAACLDDGLLIFDLD